jgi:hypothetical protein
MRVKIRGKIDQFRWDLQEKVVALNDKSMKKKELVRILFYLLFHTQQKHSQKQKNYPLSISNLCRVPTHKSQQLPLRHQQAFFIWNWMKTFIKLMSFFLFCLFVSNTISFSLKSISISLLYSNRLLNQR